MVDVCLLDSALTMVEIPAAYYLATGEEGGEGGRPPYKTKDGHVVISATSRDMATRLMTLVTGAAGDISPINSSTADDRRRALEQWCATRTTDDIVARPARTGRPGRPGENHSAGRQRSPHVGTRDDGQNGRPRRRRDLRARRHRSKCPPRPAASARYRRPASTPTKCSANARLRRGETRGVASGEGHRLTKPITTPASRPAVLAAQFTTCPRSVRRSSSRRSASSCSRASMAPRSLETI